MKEQYQQLELDSICPPNQTTHELSLEERRSNFRTNAAVTYKRLMEESGIRPLSGEKMKMIYR